ISGGHTTTRKYARWVTRDHSPSLHGAGATAKRTGVNSFALIDDRVVPSCPVLALHHVAGDLGDNRSESGDLGRYLGKTDQGRQIDDDVDLSTVAGLVVASQQEVKCHIGASLVGCSAVSLRLETTGQAVDSSSGCHRFFRRNRK